MARRNKTFTIYDRLEETGYFDSNPANIDSRGPHGEQIYKKQEFPKMVYHPEGQYKVTNPGEYIGTVMGPKLVGTQSELISKIVNDPEELAEALAAGWKRTPAESVGKSASGVPNMAVVEAIATAGMPMPTPSTDMAKALDDANARINAMLEAMTKMQTAIEAMTSKAAPELLSQPAVPVSTVGKPTGKAAPVAASASDEE